MTGPGGRSPGAGGTWLVRGDDPVLVAEAVRDLARELAADDPLAREDLGDDVGIDVIVEAVQTPPFLTDRRVVVARDVGRFVSDELAPLLAWVAEPLPGVALVLGAGGGVLSQRLVNAVKEHGAVVETTAGSRPTDRRSWLADRLRAAPVRLDRAATDRLAGHLGEDVARLSGVLAVLAAAYGDGARVGESDLEPFLGEAGGVAPWDLPDAIARGPANAGAALAVLRRMMVGGGRHPLAVMATLHRHYTAMLRLDGSDARTEQQAAALTGMAPYPAGKALKQGQGLGPAGVARAVELLAEADVRLRGASGQPGELVLEVLVSRLCHLQGGRR